MVRADAGSTINGIWTYGEWLVKKQTHDTARLYGLGDRGTIEPGMLGDLNVIDHDNLALGHPYVTADLPAGGRRILQAATG